MSTQTLSAEQLDSLVGSHHPIVGFEYPPSGLQPYYQWLMNSLHLLAEASAGGLRVTAGDESATHVNVAPGRLTLDGQIWSFGGASVDLAAFNNDVALIALTVVSDAIVVVTNASVDGWPSTPYLALAEITLSGGVITGLLDQRQAALFASGDGARGVGFECLTTAVQALWPRYVVTLTEQGTVSSPSEVTIACVSATGEPLASGTPLRVRICDEGEWTPATEATIAATGSTTVIETLTTGKDLVMLPGPAGNVEVQITDATAETVTLRLGSPSVGGLGADVSAALDVTHS